MAIKESCQREYTKANIRALISFQLTSSFQRSSTGVFPPPVAPSRMLGSSVLTAALISTPDLWDWSHRSPKPQTSIVLASVAGSPAAVLCLTSESVRRLRADRKNQPLAAFRRISFIQCGFFFSTSLASKETYYLQKRTFPTQVYFKPGGPRRPDEPHSITN